MSQKNKTQAGFNPGGYREIKYAMLRGPDQVSSGKRLDNIEEEVKCHVPSFVFKKHQNPCNLPLSMRKDCKDCTGWTKFTKKRKPGIMGRPRGRWIMSEKGDGEPCAISLT